jgi:hypothetical protein
LRSSCLISINFALIRRSWSGSRRQLSIENSCRHRGGDAGDTPLLRELHDAVAVGDGVLRAEPGDDYLAQAKELLVRVWGKRWRVAVSGWWF